MFLLNWASGWESELGVGKGRNGLEKSTTTLATSGQLRAR